MPKLFAYSRAKAPASSAKLVSFGQSCVLSFLIKIDCYASGQTADGPKPNGLS